MRLASIGAEAAVGVAEDQHGVGPLVAQDAVDRREHAADLLAEGVAGDAQVAVGLRARRARRRTGRSAAGRSSGPVCTSTCSQRPSSFSITRLRRMISGRVPRTVRTFTAAVPPRRRPCLPARAVLDEQQVELTRAPSRRVPSCTRARATSARPARRAARAASAGWRSSARGRRCGGTPLRRRGSRGPSRRGGCR